jgi:class 3 adenylate cyclase/tetratricopeptide (TPR) repeat protein
VRCTACGTENPSGSRFCLECGSPLATACPTCGNALPAGAKFCNACGTRLAEVGDGAGAVPAEPTGPAAERRLVSVLFADLVGFTTLAESLDAEEARELLSTYFDTCRRLIARYGGTVEKFIGDAVMAVWGTPVAREDDAERAVRAALDLVGAVESLGDDGGAPGLRARAGVLTGEAAVTIGAEGQGMVAGDLVNTASRIQGAADPGTILVGESTRRSTEAAVAYEHAGVHELKGKAEPIPLWRAVRVVASRGGALRPSGLEAPFVGRAAELRLVKELFHTTGEEGTAHLVSVTGIAGIGKSRLSWELEKYVDGLAETVWWHRGRCLAYGEGVTYWALAEMVRMRAGILEEEDADSALAKVRRSVAEHVTDPDERRWVEPRLAGLLGLEERGPGDRADLFSGWRLFFERLSERRVTVLVFEDLQWADVGLLDFVDHLLEWSRDHPLFILTLARPELADRRPGWGSGRRNSTSLYLDPLPADAMDDLLQGLAPGLPPELRGTILDRAEGVPLYAVETVRMLLDRGLVERDGDRFRPTAPIGDLAVPETLHALIASRLDALSPEERSVLQDASVLGKTFTVAGLTAVTGMTEDALEPILASLGRKDLVSVQANPRSPERGQYGFLQDLVRRIAYETFSKKERKARHLAVAAYLESSWGPEDTEVVEVVASHYLDAYRAAPDAEDAGRIRDLAREALTRAGERAAGLAAASQARRYFEQAAELAPDLATVASLLERAGVMAGTAASDDALELLVRAESTFQEVGETHAAARVSARMADDLWNTGRIDEALERMERAYDLLVADEPDEDLASLAHQIARLRFFHGDAEIAAERVETALVMAERLGLPEVTSQALNTKSIILGSFGRTEESMALLRHSLELALAHQAWGAALRAYFNMAVPLLTMDRYEESVATLDEALALCRRLGIRYWEVTMQAARAGTLAYMGRWEEADEDFAGALADRGGASMIGLSRTIGPALTMLIARGELEEAEARVVSLEPTARGGAIERLDYALGRALLARARGDAAQALALTDEVFEVGAAVGEMNESHREAWTLAIDSAIACGRLDRAEEHLAEVETAPRAHVSRFVWSQRCRFRARLEVDDDRAEELFREAAAGFRGIGAPYWLAVVLLESGEWLISKGRGQDATPLVEEAGEVFERLRAEPWVQRVAEATDRAGVPIGAPSEG